MAHGGYLSHEQQVRLFTGGLPDAIHVDVELQALQDLQRAMALARAYEQRSSTLSHFSIGGCSTRPLARLQQQTSSSSITSSVAAPVTSVPPPAKPFKKLSPAELMERRRLGLCYNCDEQYTRSHKCPKLFYLEVTDFEEEAPSESLQHEEEEPLISLHAISGIRTKDTMQFRVQVGDKEFTTLIDSGSTHNFFSNQASQAVGLHFEEGTSARVVVANGDRAPCSGIARDVDIEIGQGVFTINAYSIPLDCFDMVLGVSFLKPLQTILFDFDDLVMAFTYNGKRVLWKGLSSPRKEVQAPASLHSIRQEEISVLD
jgi:hypothetical protein